jgi:mono/diheme cytochrome c family protein
MRFTTTFAVIVAVVSCAAIAMAQTPSGETSKWTAPSDAAAKPNPEAANPAAPTAGRKIFLRTCVSCHGENGRGENATGANLRSSAVQAQTDGALFWKITTGNTTKGMPPFAAFSETQRWDMVTFLRTLKDSSGNGSNQSDENKGSVSKSDKHQ